MSARTAMGDWLEEFSLHDAIDGTLMVKPWCRTRRFTPALCHDHEYARLWAPRLRSWT